MEGSMITAELYSEALGRPNQISVYLPRALHDGSWTPGRTLRTVYMLPGALESGDALFTETEVASAFAEQKTGDVALIMPSPAFSYLVDYQREYQYGHQYYTYVSKELVEQTRALFPLSQRREDTAIYGCSMGGYGAWYCGLNTPETFGAVGAQSGMLDVLWAIRNRPFMTVKHQRQFGELGLVEGSHYDLFAVTARLAVTSGSKPRIYQSWGEQDYLSAPNEAMHRHIVGLSGLDYTAKVIPGPHGWGEHGSGVYKFLDWFAERGGAR